MKLKIPNNPLNPQHFHENTLKEEKISHMEDKHKEYYW